MPWSPSRLCASCGTPFRGQSDVCVACLSDRARVRAERNRARALTRVWDDVLRTKEWRDLSRRVLREEPVCFVEGCGRPSAVAHHLVGRRERPDLALERDNIRGCCRHHHAAMEWNR